MWGWDAHRTGLPQAGAGAVRQLGAAQHNEEAGARLRLGDMGSAVLALKALGRRGAAPTPAGEGPRWGALGCSPLAGAGRARPRLAPMGSRQQGGGAPS